MSERIYLPGEDDATVLSLRAKVWGAQHPHTNAEFYRWLFSKTPDGKGTGVTYERDGDIIGFAGIANRRAQIGSTVLKVAHGLEFMVDPEVEGVLSGRVAVKVLNAHAKLAEEMGFDLNLNYPNNNSHRMLISKRVRYQPVFEPSLFVCLLGPFSDIEGSIGKNTVLRLAGGLGGVYSTLRSLGAVNDIEVQEVSEFDDRFDVLWENVAQDGKLRFFRDKKTLNWRYSENPLHSYQTLVARNGELISGYVVASKRQLFGVDVLLVCDLIAPNGEHGIECGLLDALKPYAKKQGAKMIVTQAIEKSSISKSLERLGFIKIPTKINPKIFRMIMTTYSELGEMALDPNVWSFAWGDMDVV